jgi:hypothetical protein
MVGDASPPLEQEEGGVLAGDAAAVAIERVRESTHGALNGFASLLDPVQEVDQVGIAEPFAAGHALLDDAVSEEQHPVT